MKSIHALCYSSSGEKRQHLNYVASQARATLVVVSARAGPTSPTHDDGGTTSTGAPRGADLHADFVCGKGLPSAAASAVEMASSGPKRGVYRGVEVEMASSGGSW